MLQSRRWSPRVCCPTWRASLSPTSPPPCRWVHLWVCVCVSHRDDISSVKLCVESRLFLCRSGRAASEMVKWASLPRGTFLPPTATIDLFCLLIFIAGQDGATALPVSCISYSLSLSPSVFHTLELYFCVSSISPPPAFVSPSLSPSISLCQMLCPSCLRVVYIWWLTFPRVTAPFSPQCASASARLCIFYLVFPPGREMSRPFFLLLLCLFCVSERPCVNSAVWRL